MKTITEFPNYSITKDGRVWSLPRELAKIYGICQAPINSILLIKTWIHI